jgi:hypothetical protein
MTAPVPTRIFSPALVWVLSVILASQGALASFRGITSDLALLAQASALSSVTAIPLLLSSRFDRRFLLFLLATICWLLLVLFLSLSQEISLPFTWSWIHALFIALLAIRVAAHGLAKLGVLALCLPSALGAVGVAWAYGVEGVPAARLRDPNVAADALVVLLLVAIALLAGLERRSSRRAVDGGWRWGLRFPALLIPFAVGVVLSGWLGARAAMLFALPAFLLLTWPTDGRFWRLLPLALVAGYLVPEVASWSASGPGAPPGPSNSLLGTRLETIGVSLELFRSRPLVGTGLMTFSFLFPPVRDASPLAGGYMVHNDWIQLMQEAGIPFLVLLIAFAVVVLAGWWRLYRQALAARAERDVLLGVACFLSAGFVLAHAMVNFPLYDPAMLSTVLGLAGIGLTIAYPVLILERSGNTDSTQTRTTLRLAVVFVGVVLAVQWVRVAAFAVGIVVLGNGVPYPGAEPRAYSARTQFAIAERLSSWAPGFSGAPYAQGRAAFALLSSAGPAERTQLVDFGRDSYERAIDANPYLVAYYVSFAEFLEAAAPAELDARIAVLRGALARDPFAPEAWHGLAGQLIRAGRVGEAQQVLAQEWLRTCPYAVLRAPELALENYLAIEPGLRGRYPTGDAECRSALLARGLLPDRR